MDNDHKRSKVLEICRFRQKYKLAGRQCPYDFRYDSKKGWVVLDSIKILELIDNESWTAVVEIPDFVDAIDCQRLFRDDGWIDEDKNVQLANLFNTIEIRGRYNPIHGQMVGLCDLYIENEDRSYQMNGVNTIIFSEFDFTNIQSVKFIDRNDQQFNGSYPDELYKIKLENCIIPKVDNIQFLRLVATGTPDFDFGSIDLSGVQKDLRNFFYEDYGVTTESLKQIGIIDKIKPTNLKNSFRESFSLTEYPEFDVSKCRNFEKAFESTGIKGKLVLESKTLKTQSLMASKFSEEFSNTKIDQLTIRYLEIGSDSPLIDFNSMFSGCEYLKKVHIYNIWFKGEGIVQLDSMFRNCRNLEEVVIDGVIFGKRTVILQNIFSGCTKLKRIVIRGLICGGLMVQYDQSKQTYKPIISGCNELAEIDVSSFAVEKRPKVENGGHILNVSDIIVDSNYIKNERNVQSLQELTSQVQVVHNPKHDKRKEE